MKLHHCQFTGIPDIGQVDSQDILAVFFVKLQRKIQDKVNIQVFGITSPTLPGCIVSVFHLFRKEDHSLGTSKLQK